MKSLITVLAFAIILSTLVFADGGTRGSLGEPFIKITTWRTGESATLTIENAYPQARKFLLVGTIPDGEDLSWLFGPGARRKVMYSSGQYEFMVLEIPLQDRNHSRMLSWMK